ncbi:transporter substrate-binding domain-containing protein [Pseudomonas sp.]|uniref:substrate-binding periplasmic protein n=1 Tax=Pseudomonas sp. TaxID=306 RepID=UPI0028AE52F6|nr:transporter substrate-binding domain-containing protein [Pseudomonas sp.]
MFALRLLLLLGCSLLGAEALADRYVIGAEDDWYPYTALRDGKISGMSVDIVRAAFEAAGEEVELVAYPYSRCMQLARKGTIAGCFNTAPDRRIAAEFQLSQPLFSAEVLLWARREQAAPMNDLGLLAGKKVAMVLGYEYGPAIDQHPSLKRVPVRRDLNGFLMLQRGRVDYCVAYRGTSEELFREMPSLRGQFVPVASVLRPQLSLSFSRQYAGADRLRQRFDAGLKTIRENGRYQSILTAWRHETPN